MHASVGVQGGHWQFEERVRKSAALEDAAAAAVRAEKAAARERAGVTRPSSNPLTSAPSEVCPPMLTGPDTQYCALLVARYL